MPQVDIQIIEGVFDNNQKQEMIRKVTDAIVEVEGEALRSLTAVRVHEVPAANWAVGGKFLTSIEVNAVSAQVKTLRK